ncbi:MAG TPA: DUF11 domain-containing protein [Gaiellaceae bacterium]|nr:DUF11 domain-containing protein [Gaiellaceae bacterium]
MEGDGSPRPRLLLGVSAGLACLLGVAALGDARPGRPPALRAHDLASTAASARTPVTLCHATGSVRSPYVVVTTDDDGVLGSDGRALDGHDGHERDVIPPFAYMDNHGSARSYPGKSWDAAAPALLASGCAAPTSPAGPGPPAVPSTGPPAAAPLAQVDIAVAKTDAPDPATVGRLLTFTIAVSNRGPGLATDVRLEDPLPRSLELVSVSASQGACTLAPALACSLGRLAPGASATVVVRVRPRHTGAVSNTATAVAAEPEANAADNADTATTLVVGRTQPPRRSPPQVQGAACVEHRVTPLTVRVGRSARLRVVVSAAGRRVAGARVLVRGVGVGEASVTDRRGVAVVRVRARRSGFLTVTLPDRNACREARKVGVLTPLLLPPITG